MQKHSPFGPSASNAYTKCLGYVNANRGLPDRTLEVAAEGTAAHNISEWCLAYHLDADFYVGTRQEIEGFSFTWTQEDAALLQRGIDRIRAVPGKFFGEHRVDVSDWTVEGTFGTMDRAVLNSDYLLVSDLKWGRGIAVNPQFNTQATLYALGQAKQHDLLSRRTMKVIVDIDQPRNMGGGGVWETTIQEILDLGDWIRSRVQLALKPDAPRTAGDVQCAFCKRRYAKGGCSTYDNYMMDMIGIGTISDSPMLPDVAVINPHLRSQILLHKKAIEQWLKDLTEAAKQDAEDGIDLGPAKAVEGRKGRSKYVSEAVAEAALVQLLSEKAYERKLISPSLAAKLLPAETFDSKIAPLIDFGERGIEIVPLSDKRRSIQLQWEDDDA